jgi:hypothetical protein
LDDQWNAEEANRMLRAVLAEIDALADKLSPARAEATRRVSAGYRERLPAPGLVRCEGELQRLPAPFSHACRRGVSNGCECSLTDSNPWSTLMAPVLRLIPPRELARAAGVSERSIQAVRNGCWRRPRARRRQLLTRAESATPTPMYPNPLPTTSPRIVCHGN